MKYYRTYYKTKRGSVSCRLIVIVGTSALFSNIEAPVCVIVDLIPIAVLRLHIIDLDAKIVLKSETAV